MATAEGNAVADKGSAGADTSVKGVDRSVTDTQTNSDVGSVEAQRRGVVGDSNQRQSFADQVVQDALAEAKQIRQNAITHSKNVDQVALQMLTNMAAGSNQQWTALFDAYHKQSLVAIDKVNSVAQGKLQADIVTEEDPG